MHPVILVPLLVLAGLALDVSVATRAREDTLPAQGLGGDVVGAPIASHDVPSCRWSDIDVEDPGRHMPGDLTFNIRLSAHADQCALPWQPRAWAVDAVGHRHRIRSYHGLYRGRLLLPRGAVAFGGIAVDNACRVFMPMQLVIELPEGARPVASATRGTCDRALRPKFSATDFMWSLRR